MFKLKILGYRHYIIFSSTLFITLICIAGCGTEKSTNSAVEMTGTSASERYIEYCSACHGELGEGGIGRALNTDHVKEMSEAQLFMMIYDGIGSSMPAFKDNLSSDDIAGLVEYILTL